MVNKKFLLVSHARSGRNETLATLRLKGTYKTFNTLVLVEFLLGLYLLCLCFFQNPFVPCFFFVSFSLFGWLCFLQMSFERRTFEFSFYKTHDLLPKLKYQESVFLCFLFFTGPKAVSSHYRAVFFNLFN